MNKWTRGVWGRWMKNQWLSCLNNHVVQEKPPSPSISPDVVDRMLAKAEKFGVLGRIIAFEQRLILQGRTDVERAWDEEWKRSHE